MGVSKETPTAEPPDVSAGHRGREEAHEKRPRRAEGRGCERVTAVPGGPCHSLYAPTREALGEPRPTHAERLPRPHAEAAASCARGHDHYFTLTAVQAAATALDSVLPAP